MYADETHVRSYQLLRTAWSEVGQQKQVPTYGHHAHVSLFGAVNVFNGDTILHRAAAANATTFLDFLNILKDRYPNKLIVLVLDNARIHHAKMVHDFLRQEGGMLSFPLSASVFATAESDRTVVEMAQRCRHGQCVP
ncbi:transposase [Geobacillus thermodenitrificans]|uniref:transposase n=1 Tax=Geobacillus thermodenitrificans TaxID=33940 RepID=UPI00240E05A6|nr:transposase [Geobacillus thermodenitrificans]